MIMFDILSTQGEAKGSAIGWVGRGVGARVEGETRRDEAKPNDLYGVERWEWNAWLYIYITSYGM